MLLKIFCLNFDSMIGGFNDQEMREFFKDKEIISIRDHLFIRNELPYLTLVIKYFPYRIEADQQTQKTEGKRDESWRGLLQESDLGLFNILRDWRSSRCKKDGVPPYIIFTNQQLALIIKKRPQSLTELGSIEGIGKAKIDKYGLEILGFTQISDQNTQPTGG